MNGAILQMKARIWERMQSAEIALQNRNIGSKLYIVRKESDVFRAKLGDVTFESSYGRTK